MKPLSGMLIIVALTAAQADAQLPQYRILEVLGSSNHYGLNNAGHVVRALPGGSFALEHDGVQTSISSTDSTGNWNVVPNGLTDNDVVYGEASAVAGGIRRAAIWSEANGWQVLPTGPSYSRAVGVTSSGRVLVSGSEDGGAPLLGGWWTPGAPFGYVDSLSLASGCDAEGNVLFSSNPALVRRTTDVNVSLLWSGFNSLPGSINSSGRAIGYAPRHAGLTTPRAVVWATSGDVLHSYALSGQYVFASSVNDSLWSVGYKYDGSAYLDAGYVNSPVFGSVSLNSTLAPEFAGWRISYGSLINNQNQIIAKARAPGSTQDTFILLNPVPEPAEWLTLGLGVVGLLRRRRRGQN